MVSVTAELGSEVIAALSPQAQVGFTPSRCQVALETGGKVWRQEILIPGTEQARGWITLNAGPAEADAAEQGAVAQEEAEQPNSAGEAGVWELVAGDPSGWTVAVEQAELSMAHAVGAGEEWKVDFSGRSLYVEGPDKSFEFEMGVGVDITDLEWELKQHTLQIVIPYSALIPVSYTHLTLPTKRIV
eukprot:TRINITY_DN15239_c0_g1_i2.p2 TRINITY_DN15239_c0_g1~~TRINITY_DN15239_c0_g1_i2.p2  ORF type:complete len:187 (+),score=58.70 TRINITY_DN15239_c0_g1_i2:625-1185(+)